MRKQKNASLMKRLQGILGFLFIMITLITQGCQQTTEVKNTPTVEVLVEPTQGEIKFITKKPGMYRVTAQELNGWGARGWLDDASQLHLYNLGKEQSFWTEGEGEKAALIFYGAALDNVYSDENVYWLTYGDEIGKSFSWSELDENSSDSNAQATDGDQPDKLSMVEDSYYAKRRFEENKMYAPLVEDGDHWFWDKISSKQKKSYAIELDEVVDGTSVLRIAMWSATQASSSPDHHITVAVNGQLIVDESWDGSGIKAFEAELPRGVVKEGENQIEISTPGIEGVRAETNHLNWIEFEYPRKLTAINDSLEFIAGSTTLKISELSEEVSVFDISDQSKITQVLVLRKTQGGTFTFEGELGRKYLAAGSNGYVKPEHVENAQLDPNLRGSSNSGDWIAIGPAELLDAMSPLVERRTKKGLKAQMISAEAVYDQFGFGVSDPEAIRQFIAYAVENWNPVPQYIVLVGDASYDPKGYLGHSQSNRLPSFLIQTHSSGETVSDVKFVELGQGNNELLANIAIGRIPAQTPKQVETIVKKIIQYEIIESSGIDASVLAVADGQEVGFAEDARSFLKIFTSGYKTTLLAPEAGATDIPQQIVQNITDNDFLVAYFGHGSINMWGKDMLFSNDNVKELSNLKHYPIILNFTCLTGLFSHPEQESLAEALLWQANGGAVAVIAPTSLTLASDQSFLSRPLATSIVENPNTTIGTLLQEVRLDMANKGDGVRDVMLTFLLLGDPATQLTRP